MGECIVRIPLFCSNGGNGIENWAWADFPVSEAEIIARMFANLHISFFSTILACKNMTSEHKDPKMNDFFSFFFLRVMLQKRPRAKNVTGIS